jgi:hypothetical protein
MYLLLGIPLTLYCELCRRWPRVLMSNKYAIPAPISPNLAKQLFGKQQAFGQGVPLDLNVRFYPFNVDDHSLLFRIVVVGG